MAFFDRFGGKKKPKPQLTPEEINRLVEEADRLCENEEYARAFDLDSKAAEAGNARAQTHMGWYYENGCGAPQDYNRAFEWYSMAAKQNFAPAQYCIGTCFEEGIGTTVDLTKAIEYYTLAANQGLPEAVEALDRIGKTQHEEPALNEIQIQRIANEARRLFVQERYDEAIDQARTGASYNHPEAMHVLGCCLLHGLGTEVDIEGAEKWLSMAADAGFHPAMLELGLAYAQGHTLRKDLAAAANRFEAAVNAGSTSAYFHLGQCYEYGEGMSRDISNAIDLYRKGAEAGDAAAQFALGQCYMTGTGVEEDYEAASRLFKASADQGYENAREGLALLDQLQSGADTEIMQQKLADAEKFIADRNYDAARPLVEECAEVGMPHAQALLGDFYRKALAGYPRDSRKALEWYRHGADGGDVDAMVGAAAILETDGKDADIAEAARYYEAAAEKGSIEAAYRLGQIYENGRGVGKDETMAFAWYLRAADAGDAISQRLIGAMYESGRGVDTDTDAALEWYRKAAANGDIAAKKAVERLSAPVSPKTETEDQTDETPGAPLSDEEIVHLIVLSNKYYDAGNYEAAVDIDRKLTLQKVPRGMNALGWDYYKGHGVPQDVARAFNLFLEAAEAGEPRAMINLAWCYHDGDGVAQDKTEAMRWFKRAADAGWHAGFFALGARYSLGDGVEQNDDEAVRLWQKAADLGNPSAYYCLGVHYAENSDPDYNKAFKLYLNSALLGIGTGAYQVAHMLQNGIGCTSDIDRAIYFYRVAVALEVEEAREALEELDVHVRLSEEERQDATNKASETYSTDRDKAGEYALLPAVMGDPWAAEILALSLAYGSFVDDRRASEMFRMAAEGGLSASQHNLGWRYEKGIGVDVDPIESAYWYAKAAENGNAAAMSCYAWCLTIGFGVKKDYAAARQWYIRAGELNDARAFYNLGVMCERGEGGPIDYEEARRLYRKAADLDYEGAEQAIRNIEGKKNPTGSPEELLANEADRLYDEGQYDQAFAKALKPADAGNPVAAQIAGLCYEFGRGTDKDMVKAVRYYKIAAEAGLSTSLLNLGVAYQYGEGGLDIDLKKAVDLYRKAAEKGDRIAQCNLGYCYEQGDGVEKDMSLAAYWYRKSADQYWGRAQAYLGECYEKGWGLDENHKTALNLYFKAASNGHPYGQMRLGRCYEYAIGTSKNIDEAIRWYKKAAEGGNEFAKKRLNELQAAQKSGIPYEVVEQGRKADEAYGAGRYDEAFRLARNPAEAGDPRACEVMALCYDFGNGTASDMVQAVRFYKVSAAAGMSVSQLNLGVAYENGDGGLTRDYVKAAELYRAAAEQGHRIAQCNLGWCYEKGLGVPKDMTLAVKWYAQSADQNWPRAQLNLGTCYEFGKGVTEDHQKAVEFYRAAAEQGNSIAQCNLGWCYESGKGIAQNFAEAAEWYRKSAAQGWARAQAYLGELYEKGNGVPRDIAKAIELYRASAEQNYAYGQCALAQCYENGTGVPRDIKRARELYKQAAENGNEFAKKRLKEL